ncbi:MAG: hypothetical protein KAS32_30355 [Candidatus Peribacteraceae bacterium]|nr:hypothetical protein [Candidatus Peribacteraceae bacterium]
MKTDDNDMKENKTKEYGEEATEQDINEARREALDLIKEVIETDPPTTFLFMCLTEKSKQDAPKEIREQLEEDGEDTYISTAFHGFGQAYNTAKLIHELLRSNQDVARAFADISIAGMKSLQDKMMQQQAAEDNGDVLNGGGEVIKNI